MIILWVLSIIASTALCWKHDHALIGFLLGFFLGPIGALIALFLRMHWSASASRDEQIAVLRKLAQQHEDKNSALNPYIAAIAESVEEKK